MPIRAPLALSILVLMLSAATAGARDIYVNNLDGDDAATGRSAQSSPDRTGPVKTIAKALRLAETGDRIVLAKTSEPYRESVSLVGSRHSGRSWQPFVLAGNGAVLDGSAPVPKDAWEHYLGAVFRFRPARLGHQQLFLKGRPAPRVMSAAVGGGVPELNPGEWCLHEDHIYFCVQPTRLPQDYELTCAALETGITLFHVEHVAILDLTVQGYQLDGISAFNSARRVRIAGVTARGNGRSGIAVGGASQVEIDACLVGNNGAAQLLTLPLSETHVRNSELLGNTAPAWVDQGGRTYVGQKLLQGGLDEIKPEGPAVKFEKP